MSDYDILDLFCGLGGFSPSTCSVASAGSHKRSSRATAGM